MTSIAALGSRAKQAARWLAEIVAQGYRLIVVHGNGPQVGNILIQAIGAGEVSGLADAREIVRQSTKIEQFLPQASGQWDQAYEKFLAIVRR